MINDTKGGTKNGNYLIRLEHYMLTLFSVLFLQLSKIESITLKGTDSKIFSRNGHGTIPSHLPYSNMSTRYHTVASDYISDILLVNDD